MTVSHPLAPDQAPPPAWLAPTIQALYELLHLPENWDSYGASPIDPRLVVSAIRLLATTMGGDTPAPVVVPTNRGGVLLEWHMRGIDLEVETLSESRCYVFFEDHRLDRTWEGMLTLDLAPLAERVAELSQRA